MVKMDLTLKTRIKQTIKSITFEDLKVHLVLISVCLVFSVFYIVAKLALNEMPVFFFLMIRLAIATPLLWIAGMITSRDTIFKLPSKKEFIFLAVSGLFSVTVNQSLFLLGLGLSTASNAAITQPAIPIFSTLFAVMLGFERKTKLKFLGIAIAVVGAILMVDFTHLASDDSSSKDIVLGNLCFLGNTIAYAIFLLTQKPLVDDGGMSAIKCMAWSFTIGTPPVVLICLLVTKDISMVAASVSLLSWLAIIYTAIFATAFAFFASSWAVAKSDSTTVSIYLTVEPLLTGVLANIFLHEILTPLNIVGGVVILIGVGAVMASKYREDKKDKLNTYENEKLKTYDMNNGTIEIPEVLPKYEPYEPYQPYTPIKVSKKKNKDNNNNSNNTSVDSILSKENSYSQIINSNSIVQNTDILNDSLRVSTDQQINNNNNNTTPIDIYNSNNSNNSNNNFYNNNNGNNNYTSVFNSRSILNEIESDSENNENGGSIIVF